MTSIVVVVAVLAAAPVKVAAPGLSGVNASAELLTFVNDHLSQELTLEGVEVTTPAQIAAVVGIERQKQLLGCGESQCAAELANALGVDAILLGSVAKLGAVIQLDTRLIGASDAKVVTLFSKRLDSEAQLLDAMTEAARAMAPQLSKKLGRQLTPTRAAEPPPLPSRQRDAAAPTITPTYERKPTTVRKVGMWTMIGGSVAAVGSLVGLFIVIDTNAPADAPLTPTESALIGTMFVGVGVALVGLLVYAIGGTEMVPVSAGLVPLDGGGLMSFSVRLP
ncbi:MAG: hypothetical protein JNM69_31720 [Archangium sp.]|nr:hypothetical protein [Archangium sp.]